MPTDIADLPTRGGFLKAEEYLDYPALLVEVQRFVPQVPSNFGPKDTVHADITAFEDGDEAGKLELVSEAKGLTIQQTALVSDLRDSVGKAFVVTIGQSKPKAGQRPAWVWNRVDAQRKKAVVAWVQERDAAIEAALSDDETPDFLK